MSKVVTQAGKVYTIPFTDEQIWYALLDLEDLWKKILAEKVSGSEVKHELAIIKALTIFQLTLPPIKDKHPGASR